MEKELKVFFSNLSYRIKIVEKTQDAIAPLFSPKFNVFDFILPDENRISDILACLLNPSGEHAQRELFLKHFLRHFCNIGEIPSYEEVLVLREPYTALIEKNRRRMDILIHIPGLAPVIRDYGIAIENKPWASEQVDQLKDYVEELRSRYDDQFTLVYLSRNGDLPTSISKNECEKLTDKGHLICKNYGFDMLQWLEDCESELASDKMRWFLRDFFSYVYNEFVADEAYDQD